MGSMKDKIIQGVGVLIIISLLFSLLFMGYKVYSLNKRVAITEQGIAQIVSFINQAIQANQK